MKTLLTLPLLTLLLFSSCSSERITTEVSTESYFASAKTHFEQGSYEEALSSVYQAMELDSTPIEYHELLGKILWEMGDTAHSNQEFEFVMSAMQEEQLEIENLESLIAWELEHHNKDEAKVLLDKDLEFYKNDHNAQSKIIKYAFQQYMHFGNPEEAVEFLEATLKTYPDNTSPYKFLADYLFRKKEYREARSNYLKYIESHANDDDALFHLGVCYLDAKNKSKAKKYFEQAKDLGHLEACQNYRELSAKTRYYVQSRCCDGTSSSSTGRGTCSHHGGVCRTEHVPYKEYTTNCK